MPVTCSICLEEDLHEVGELSSCAHRFCFSCITRWAETENSCPLCKEHFIVISRKRLRSADAKPRRGSGGDDSDDAGPLKKLKGTVLETRVVASKRQTWQPEGGLSHDYLDALRCQFCGTGEDDELLLLCDGCDTGWHTYCVGLDAVPPDGEEWLCPRCVYQSAELGPLHARQAQPVRHPVQHQTVNISSGSDENEDSAYQPASGAGRPPAGEATRRRGRPRRQALGAADAAVDAPATATDVGRRSLATTAAGSGRSRLAAVAAGRITARSAHSRGLRRPTERRALRSATANVASGARTANDGGSGSGSGSADAEYAGDSSHDGDPDRGSSASEHNGSTEDPEAANLGSASSEDDGGEAHQGAPQQSRPGHGSRTVQQLAESSLHPGVSTTSRRARSRSRRNLSGGAHGLAEQPDAGAGTRRRRQLQRGDRAVAGSIRSTDAAAAPVEDAGPAATAAARAAASAAAHAVASPVVRLRTARDRRAAVAAATATTPARRTVAGMRHHNDEMAVEAFRRNWERMRTGFDFDSDMEEGALVTHGAAVRLPPVLPVPAAVLTQGGEATANTMRRARNGGVGSSRGVVLRADRGGQSSGRHAGAVSGGMTPQTLSQSADVQAAAAPGLTGRHLRELDPADEQGEQQGGSSAAVAAEQLRTATASREAAWQAVRGRNSTGPIATARAAAANRALQRSTATDRNAETAAVASDWSDWLGHTAAPVSAAAAGASARHRAVAALAAQQRLGSTPSAGGRHTSGAHVGAKSRNGAVNDNGHRGPQLQQAWSAFEHARTGGNLPAHSSGRGGSASIALGRHGSGDSQGSAGQQSALPRPGVGSYALATGVLYSEEERRRQQAQQQQVVQQSGHLSLPPPPSSRPPPWSPASRSNLNGPSATTTTAILHSPRPDAARSSSHDHARFRAFDGAPLSVPAPDFYISSPPTAAVTLAASAGSRKRLDPRLQQHQTSPTQDHHSIAATAAPAAAVPGAASRGNHARSPALDHLAGAPGGQQEPNALRLHASELQQPQLQQVPPWPQGPPAPPLLQPPTLPSSMQNAMLHPPCPSQRPLPPDHALPPLPVASSLPPPPPLPPYQQVYASAVASQACLPVAHPVHCHAAPIQLDTADPSTIHHTHGPTTAQLSMGSTVPGGIPTALHHPRDPRRAGAILTAPAMPTVIISAPVPAAPMADNTSAMVQDGPAVVPELIAMQGKIELHPHCSNNSQHMADAADAGHDDGQLMHGSTNGGLISDAAATVRREQRRRQKLGRASSSHGSSSAKRAHSSKGDAVRGEGHSSKGDAVRGQGHSSKGDVFKTHGHSSRHTSHDGRLIPQSSRGSASSSKEERKHKDKEKARAAAKAAHQHRRARDAASALRGQTSEPKLSGVTDLKQDLKKVAHEAVKGMLLPLYSSARLSKEQYKEAAKTATHKLAKELGTGAVSPVALSVSTQYSRTAVKEALEEAGLLQAWWDQGS